MAGRLIERPRSEPAHRAGLPLSAAGSAGGGLAFGFAIFALYFLAYPIRHLVMPMGFDPAYYVWRAQYLGSQGLGSGGTAGRPGFPILTNILAAVTGRSDLQMVLLLSLVLVAALALAVGAFYRAALEPSRWGWAVVVAVTGVVLGPTHLVGENLSNALNLLLEVAALVALSGAVAEGRAGPMLWAAVALLVAGGLAHWDFLGVFEVVLVIAVAMAGRSSLRAHRDGMPLLRTEAGLLSLAGASAGSLMAVTIVGILRAHFKTIEIGSDTLLFSRKFRTDLARTIVPSIAGLIGVGAVPTMGSQGGRSGVAGAPTASRAESSPGLPGIRPARRSFALRFLKAWTYVMAAGIAYGLVTLNVPPARFLALLVALPGALALGAALALLAGRLRRRIAWRRGRVRGGAAGTLLVVVAVSALAIPAALRWYRYPVLMDRESLREVQTADGYVRTLPPHTPVVFVVSYVGRPSSYTAVVKERTIRMGLSPSRELDVHVFVGEPADALAGLRTSPPDQRIARITAPYWNDVRGVLPSRPPILVIRALGKRQYREARGLGGRVIGPNVVLLQGPPPTGPPLQLTRLPQAIPSLPAGLGWGIGVLALLVVAGGGWTRLVAGREAAPEVIASLAPAVGAAALIVAGMLAAKAGIPLRGVGGVVTYLVIGVAGWVAGAVGKRRGSPPAG